MIRGTTPTFVLTVEGYNLVTDATVFVTFEQGNKELTKTGSDLALTATADGNTIVTLTLSQEETLAFAVGRAEIQIRFIRSNNKAYATERKSIAVKEVLYEEVIEYGS